MTLKYPGVEWTISDEWTARFFMLFGVVFLVTERLFELKDRPLKRSWF